MLRDDGSFVVDSETIGPCLGETAHFANVVDDGSPKETALHRHFDKNKKLLYVGISLCAINRLSQHRDASDWYRDIASVSIEWFPSRGRAIDAERIAVRCEFPIHNIQWKKWLHHIDPPTTARLVSKISLLQRVTYYKPMYTISEVSKILAVRPMDVRRLAQASHLGTVDIPSGQGLKSVPMVSGWQLPDYIESLEKATKPK